MNNILDERIVFIELRTRLLFFEKFDRIKTGLNPVFGWIDLSNERLVPFMVAILALRQPTLR